jgi:glycosyltransferase involved in cell wall biosynthesis
MPQKVLQIAYACNPAGHGEHWLGWAWAEQARTFADVHLITFPWHREQVQAASEQIGIHPHFLDVPRAFDRVCSWLSLPGRYLRQALWQRRLQARVRELHARERFDLVHQTTYHTFRVPFRAALALDIPAVWGPLAGGENVPPGYFRYLGPARWTELQRPLLNRASLSSPSVQSALRRANALLVSNRTTLNYLPDFCREKSTIMPPNALRGDLPLPPMRHVSAPGTPLRLFFAGNCAGTRAIPLVMEAMRLAQDCPAELTIAGQGAAVPFWKSEAARLGISVRFTGHVSRTELADLYASADAFVFPALRDSGGSGLLESMSLGLPVICLDWGGPAEMVDSTSGIKVSVADPASTVRELADAIRRIRRDPAFAASIGQNAIERCRREFTWDHKREILEGIYRSVTRK